MITFLTIVICLSSIFLSKILFQKWFNHLMIYVSSWSLFIILYELKLIKYTSVSDFTYTIVFVAFISFFLGILTVFSARASLNKDVRLFDVFRFVKIDYFPEKTKLIKVIILTSFLLGLIAAVDYWTVLINKFGSIPAVFLKVNVIYSMRVSGELTGNIPYLITVAYVGVFFSAIYTVYLNRLSFYSVMPLISIILHDAASAGRTGIFIGLLIFICTFFLYSHLLSSSSTYKIVKKTPLIISFVFLFAIAFTSMALIKSMRTGGEQFQAASRSLNANSSSAIISPSVYLYFSSNVAVLSKYFEKEAEHPKFGENTLLPIYNVLAKFNAVEKPKFYMKGYQIPMWTNSATYLRELHADFGFLGIILYPYLLGLLTTFFWFRFFTKNRLYDLVILIHLFLLVSLSVFYQATRSAVWSLNLIMTIIVVRLLEKRTENKQIT